MYDNNDRGLTEPPIYDMLTIRFRGDMFDISLPYCEVANGDITQVENNVIELVVAKDDKLDRVKMSFSDFAKVIETTFDLKEIKELSVQLAGSYDTTRIYES